MEPVTIAALVGVLASILGVLSTLLANRLFRWRKRYGPANAQELLVDSRPEEWNEVRILHPDWIPDLRNAQLAGISVPSANLAGARLDGANLREANLEGAVLDSASLVESDLTRARLVGASLANADLRGARLKEALLSQASFSGAAYDQDLEVAIPEEEPSGDTSVEAILRRGHSTPEELSALNPRELEHLVVKLLKRDGYRVEVARTGGDRGFDIVAFRHDPLLGQDRMLVEVKKYSRERLVGVSAVRSFVGAVLAERAARGLFFTTSGFSREAAAIPQQFPQIRLIDGRGMLKWIESGTGPRRGAGT